jgi:hypothetical protein
LVHDLIFLWSQGHVVCEITGCCVKNIAFASTEYVENACVDIESYNRQSIKKRKTSIPNIMQCNRKNRIRDWIHRRCDLQQNLYHQQIDVVDFNTRYHEVYNYIGDILCSETWTTSHLLEKVKNDNKMKVCVIKYIRNYKITHEGFLPIIPDIISHINHSLTDSRFPIDPVDYTLSTRKKISERCTDAICHHLYFLTNVCSARISKSKLQVLCVGLLYILRNGLSMYGVVILPKIPILSALLPQEG